MNKAGVQESDLWLLATSQCDSNLGIILRGEMHVNNNVNMLLSLHNISCMFIYSLHLTVEVLVTQTQELHYRKKTYLR